ncbi:hypothetical protein T492DRAFT_922629 [Pavlovales sp. CCMP2436]|nr:hypothetical protein T492DRAFT_922629 [Pavlovales sp. CCMP2436]
MAFLPFAPAAKFTPIAGLEKALGSAAGALPVLISCTCPFARPDRSRAADKCKAPHVLWPARREDLARASGRGRSRALSAARGPRARRGRGDGCYGRPRCLAGLKCAARARRDGSSSGSLSLSCSRQRQGPPEPRPRRAQHAPKHGCAQCRRSVGRAWRSGAPTRDRRHGPPCGCWRRGVSSDSDAGSSRTAPSACQNAPKVSSGTIPWSVGYPSSPLGAPVRHRRHGLPRGCWHRRASSAIDVCPLQASVQDRPRSPRKRRRISRQSARRRRRAAARS